MTTPPYARGDVVSFSRAQIQRVTVLDASPAPSTPYSVTLGDRTFTYLAPNGQSQSDVAAALAAVLSRDQTVYAVDRAWSVIAIVGPLAVAFTASTTANMSTVLDTLAVRGRIDEPLRVLHARQFFTRTAAVPEAVEKWMIRVRAIGRDEYETEVHHDEILTLISPAGANP